jgi:acyl-coenzyme A thioesterase PaaI-like protein
MRTDAANAVRRVGIALSSRDLPAEILTEIAAVVSEIADRAEESPVRDKRQDVLLPDRFAAFIETGELPEPPADGAEIEFDPMSIVGGNLNPFGLRAEYHRDGDDAVGRLVGERPFEGPPERMHGGMVAAAFDEVMGCVLRVLGEFAYTGSLSIRLESGAPIDRELEFRARLRERDGRKLIIEAEGTVDARRFASAEAVFVQVDPETILNGG